MAGMEQLDPHVASNAQNETPNLKSWLENTLATDP
jgi:hypothetical protein